jgi:hypothetical protein
VICVEQKYTGGRCCPRVDVFNLRTLMQFGAEVLKKNLCPNISSALAECVFNNLMFTKLSYFELAPRA